MKDTEHEVLIILIRCDKEEARIKAWEELQTSKAEAEMQKLEVSTVLQLLSSPDK